NPVSPSRISASNVVDHITPIMWRSQFCGVQFVALLEELGLSYNYRVGHHINQTGAAFSHQPTLSSRERERPMGLYVGTSGYSYKEWKGKFYPKDLPVQKMLRFYGERFRTVEINSTFYGLPKASVLEGWAYAVPAD